MITNTIADNIISGKFKSPYMPLGNDEYPQEDAVYVDLRITGTGFTKREKEGEIIDIDRPFEQFSDKVFLDSCLGLPITISHPEDNVHSGNYKDQVIGSIVKSYIKGKEIWGVGKIYDPRFFDTIKQGIKSTSPSVISNDIKQDDGTYKEDFLNINHLAIVPEGHWDGVASTKPAIRMDEKHKQGEKIMTNEDLLTKVGELDTKVNMLWKADQQGQLKLDEASEEEKKKEDEKSSDEPKAEPKEDACGVKKDEDEEKKEEEKKKEDARDEGEPKDVEVKDDACGKKDEKDEEEKKAKDDIAKRLDALEAIQKEMKSVNQDSKKDAAIYMDAADETDKIALHNDLMNCFTSKKDIKIPKMDGLSSVGYMSLALSANKSFVNEKYHPLLSQKLDSGYKSILKEAFVEMIGNIKAEALKQDNSNKTVMPDGSIIYNSGLLYPKK